MWIDARRELNLADLRVADVQIGKSSIQSVSTSSHQPTRYLLVGVTWAPNKTYVYAFDPTLPEESDSSPLICVRHDDFDIKAMIIPCGWRLQRSETDTGPIWDLAPDRLFPISRVHELCLRKDKSTLALLRQLYNEYLS